MSSTFGNTSSTLANNSAFGNQPATSQPASLFGSLNLPKTTAPTTSMFGSTLQLPQEQRRTSLFGALPATSQSPQSTLASFGGFGNTTQTETTRPSLFGGLSNTTQPQQPSGTSLFGSIGNPSQPQQQPSNMLSGTTAFGSTGTNQQPHPLAARSDGSTTQAPAQSGAYFDSLLEKSRKRAYGETALEELPTLQLGLGDLRQRIKKLGPSSVDRAADGRAHYLLAASGVEPGSAIRDLRQLDGQPTRTEKTRPAGLADTDVEGYLASLQTQTTLSMIADGLARSVRDFDSFLEENVTMEWDAQRKRIYEHFGIKPRYAERSTRPGGNLGGSELTDKGGFGKSRRSKGQPSSSSRGAIVQNGSTFGRSSLQKSIIGSAGPLHSQPLPFADVDLKGQSGGGGTLLGAEDRFVREKESRFTEKVQELNAARLERRSFPLLQEFANAEKQSSDSHVPDVVNAYEGMIEIIGENIEAEAERFSRARAPKERQFAEAYLDEAPQSAKARQLRKAILRGANRHFEIRFFRELEDLIEKNPREANLGGVPNALSKVKAYVRLRAARKDLAPDNTNLQMLGDDFVWAVIFYLLRCGHLREAADYVVGNAAAFRAIDRNFIPYITNYVNSEDRRLSRELQDRIHNEYNQRLRIAPENSIDPYRMACYKVVGRCDLLNKSFHGLRMDLQDFFYLQFVLAREVNPMDEIASDVHTLANVQETIVELGSKYFTKGGSEQVSGFGMYFYLQILGGLFESAIRFLYDHQYVDATHFAIALDYYGLLRVSSLNSSGGELLNYDTRGRAQINFAQMIGWYTRDFRAGNIVAAVDYLALICLNADLPGDAGREQASICHQGLREVVLESREFAKLLGDMQMDGQRIKGAIEQRMRLLGLADTDDFMRTVTIQAASMADDNGRTTDAVLLYHLAGEYDNVVAIVNRALSEAVAVEIGQDKISLLPLLPRFEQTAGITSGPVEQGGPDQQSDSLSLTSVDDPVKLAETISAIYGRNPMYYAQIGRGNREACRILLQMNGAKSMVEEGQWSAALDMIKAINILPLEARGDSTIIRQCAAKYSSFPETITRNVPNLINWTIRSCSQQRNILANAQYGSNDGTRREMIEELKTKAKDLMMYVGFLKYRLPTSVNDSLARIAAE